MRNFINIINEAQYLAYHGTKSPIDFDAFSLDFFGSSNPSTDTTEVPCIWASEKPNTAISFSGASPHGHEQGDEDGARVIPVHVHLNNPMIVDAEEDKDFHRSDKYINRKEGRLWNLGHIKFYYLRTAKDRGYDGVIFKNCYDGWAERGDIYAVFDPNNIEPKMGKSSL